MLALRPGPNSRRLPGKEHNQNLAEDELLNQDGERQRERHPTDYADCRHEELHLHAPLRLHPDQWHAEGQEISD